MPNGQYLVFIARRRITLLTIRDIEKGMDDYLPIISRLFVILSMASSPEVAIRALTSESLICSPFSVDSIDTVVAFMSSENDSRYDTIV